MQIGYVDYNNPALGPYGGYPIVSRPARNLCDINIDDNEGKDVLVNNTGSIQRKCVRKETSPKPIPNTYPWVNDINFIPILH